MTNPNSTELIIIPPGELILTSPWVKITPAGEVHFENSFNRPLPSLVEAKWNSEKNCIDIRTLIFVDSGAPLSSVKVNQLFSVSNFGYSKLQLFIYCSKEEIEKLTKYGTKNKYKAYTLEFSTNNSTNFPEGIRLNDIKIVQTFLWNIDPETSRGTETTVQTTG
ncbi:hypothetical protein ACQY1Q_05215 [Tenacibaculum sp. TC6]|uniref:hypothetical protein n=1 Tax=Tenacibaculum sp. TC6 TaxID=3423223 RepID=UPI003D3673CB